MVTGGLEGICRTCRGDQAAALPNGGTISGERIRRRGGVGRSAVQGAARLPKAPPGGIFSTWLTRILLNVCADEKKRRRRFLDPEELPETAAEAYDSLPLREAVRKLPEELKSIVILRYFSGYTLRETAEIMGIPLGTAATRQKRALALLRLEFGEEETK